MTNVRRSRHNNATMWRRWARECE